MDLVQKLQTLSVTLRSVSASVSRPGLQASTEKRHNWTPEEIEALLSQYKDWGVQAGPDKLFRLKEFILSLRPVFPFLQNIDDTSFYNRVKRVLYRSLVRFNVIWKHSGKRALKDKPSLPAELKQVLNDLEEVGIGIAEDGSVLIAFTLSPFTGEDDGYEIYDIVSAISHLQKVATNPHPLLASIREEAQQAIALLQKLLTLWSKDNKSDQVYKPPEYKTLSQDYVVAVDPTDKNMVNVTKSDGTVYHVNKTKHTCTCPAGQAGRPCKHLRTVLYEHNN